MTAYQGGIAKFKSADTVIVGISTDDLETQTKFAESLNLEFALLSDKGGAATKSFGILNERGMASRYLRHRQRREDSRSDLRRRRHLD